MAESLEESYSTSGLSARLGFGRRPVLVVVDFAKAYVDPAAALYARAHDALASTLRLIAAARASETPVIYTKVVYHDGASEAGVFWRKAGVGLSCFNHDNPFSAFADGIEPLAGETVIEKHYASSFFQTDLDAVLRKLGVDTVIIAGTSTSGCVRATAVDACQYGYAPMVVREAVADRHAAPHESNLFDLDAKYADVVSEEETLAYLSDKLS